MNIAIYARVSTAAQAEKGYSLETQVEACEKKAVSLGATFIKKYIDDGYSGAYLERPALDDLRAAVVNWFTQNYITAEQATEKLEALKRKEKSLQAQAVKKDIDAAKIHKAMKPKKLTYEEKRNAILSVCSKIYITRAGGKYGKKYELKIDFVFK